VGLDYFTMREMSVPDLKCGAFFFGTVPVFGFGNAVVFAFVVAMGINFVQRYNNIKVILQVIAIKYQHIS